MTVLHAVSCAFTLFGAGLLSAESNARSKLEDQLERNSLRALVYSRLVEMHSR